MPRPLWRNVKSRGNLLSGCMLFRRLTSFDLYGFKPYPLRRSYPMTPPPPRTLRFDIRSLGSTFGGNQEDSSPVSGWVFHTVGRLAVSKTFQRRHIVSLLVFDARSAMSLRGRFSLFRLKMSRCSSSIPDACFNRFMTRQCTCGYTEHRH